MNEPEADSQLSSVPPSVPPVSSSPARSDIQVDDNVPDDLPEKREPIQSKPIVLVPSLSPSTKEKYKPREETNLEMEMDIDLDEVIGEYREGNSLYYFARFQEGIAHKYLSTAFVKRHPDLVEAYSEFSNYWAFNINECPPVTEKAKEEGKYADFDPSAHYVHPMSRVKMKLNISRDKATVSISSARSVRSDDASVLYISDSEEERTTGSGAESYVGTPGPARRSTRQSTMKQGKLPFSPRKTRSQKVIAVDSDSDDDSSRPSRRRSARQKATVKVNLDSDYEEDEEGDDYSEYSYAKPSKGKKVAAKVPIPSYGHIRKVQDLKYDPYPDDEDNIALRAHRNICEKCHLRPAHILLRNLNKSKGKGKKRKRSPEDDFEMSDSERFNNLGGWVQCLKCPVAVHWQCLAGTQQGEILKAARSKDKADWVAKGAEGNPPRRSGLDTEEATEFVCASCNRGGPCMGCLETVQHVSSVPEAQPDENGDVEMTDPSKDKLELARILLFRCFTCKRLAHYEHLQTPPSLDPDASVSEVATYYQNKNWLCADCVSFRYPLDKILAWRPYPPNAAQPENPNIKDQLPREYLVKWAERSYRRLSWVPHMWLLSTNQQKLKHFLAGGAKVNLLKEIPEGQEVDGSGEPNEFEIGAKESRASSSHPGSVTTHGPLDALPDAEKRIPPPWTTVDRVLDLVFWDDQSGKKGKKKKGSARNSRRQQVIESESEGEDMEEDEPEEVTRIFETGELLEDTPTLTAAEWEAAYGDIAEKDIDKVVYAFIKWDDLGYDETSWDSPPRRGEPGYDAFARAFKRFLHSRTVLVPKRKPAEQDKFDNRPLNGYGKYRLKDPAGLELGQDPSLKLMPFQVDGFNWLCDNWWNRQPCILADDMGLGKTVQVSSFLGTVATKWQAYPALVVVPNSTITNWVREFERWAPSLRVVPFYGEKKAREVIKQFELFHERVPDGYTSAKFHVLVTTYEGITGTKDWGAVFKRQPRWEVLVVDEGQRLKSDSSLLFRKLNELTSGHRVIMTGTPLNNNMRELFNLMNFLDPEEWNNLEELERQYEELDEELVKQLHNRLRPYFLRRIKSEVLQLPPKNEVIVPVSMAPLQKQVYRSILSHNLDLLKGLTQPNRASNALTKGKLNNVLMHLRKCLQHPYLYAEDIEPQGLPPDEVHHKLIDASAKLRFLKLLLPKLKARGHRVLLFSQDGSTKGTERQKCMDEFNKPNSEYFIFLLTTRAGGVGINLFTADTVIIFDPDFNPHQDLQAIARAYRYGQKNTCLVFKLMVKDSAEERIMQIGKKKLVLDHLIVQKMDDDEDSPGENIQSILTYGAQALFDEQESAQSKDITYSEQDIEKLIEKTETEGEQTEGPKEGGMSFSFAKVWATDRNALDEVGDEDQVDSWALTLEMINKEREKERALEQALSGRGARRKAADVAKTKMVAQDSFTNDSPVKHKKGSSVVDLDFEDNDSIASESTSHVSIRSDDEDFAMDIDKPKKKSRRRPSAVVHLEDIPDVARQDLLDCGLCGGKHGIKQCLMTDNSENLAEYRMMLIYHADDEPYEERYAAVRAIDELLNSRGQLRLIQGQPLHPLPKEVTIPPTKKPKQAADAAKEYIKKQKAGQVHQPTLADYRGGSEEIEVVRSFRTVDKNNAVAGPSRPRPALPAAVPTATQSAPVTTATPQQLPPQHVANSSSKQSTFRHGQGTAPLGGVLPAAGPSNSSVNGTSNQAQTRPHACRLCNRVPSHKLKECPRVKGKSPAELRDLIQTLENGGNPLHVDIAFVLKAHLQKAEKKT
ncbi:SHREC complex subunit Mit1 [Coprinopsis cinerea okayama7|uniref:SHREC complex subunit Mit1 n=1 Tax=Coprinopsis cinerea (strain Okayama-7 / 130 / ATCC MYA-4618 / FGSC 9003) TaxID=240176 RepID=A8N2C3_COPC7|nr:SHREC complex subunit Mit1 [Coprinopsis cinerea okayama7\|eukprot:XP_001829083.2 SHREC complex subunit Mit1 [Coprinopsis cinerea okayama7\